MTQDFSDAKKRRQSNAFYKSERLKSGLLSLTFKEMCLVMLNNQLKESLFYFNFVKLNKYFSCWPVLFMVHIFIYPVVLTLRDYLNRYRPKPSSVPKKENISIKDVTTEY